MIKRFQRRSGRKSFNILARAIAAGYPMVELSKIFDIWSSEFGSLSKLYRLLVNKYTVMNPYSIEGKNASYSP